MSRYSDEQKAESIRRARELLEQLDEDPNMQHEPLEDPAEDPVAKWRREHEELEAERTAFREREAADNSERRTRDWEAWLRGHLEAERQLIIEAAGRGAGKIRADLQHEFRAAIDELRDELRRELANAKARGDETVKELRQELTIAKARGDGSIIDISPTSSSVVRKTKSTSSDAA